MTRTDASASTQQQQQQQRQQVSKEAWDKEMEDKAEGWDKQWDADRQRFYYYRAETGEASYTAPFIISVSLGCSGGGERDQP